MSFEPWHEDELLIRFEHLLEKGEDPEYSKPVTFNLRDVLKDFKIVDIRETTLDGNEWLDSMKRLKFKSDPENTVYTDISNSIKDNENESQEIDDLEKDQTKRMIEINKIKVPDIISENLNEEVSSPVNDNDKFRITLKPMQIRTFILNLEPQI